MPETLRKVPAMFEYVVMFFLGLVFIPICFLLLRLFGIYTIVKESEAQVFTLFGKVVGTIDEPGLHFPFAKYGLSALLLPFFRKKTCGQYGAEAALLARPNGEFGGRHPDGSRYLV